MIDQSEGVPMSASTNHQSTQPFEEGLESALVNALARVRAVTEAKVRTQWHEHGDVEVKSVEAEAVVVFVEAALGEADLAEVADLSEDQLTSLRSLGQLLQSKRPTAASGAAT